MWAHSEEDRHLHLAHAQRVAQKSGDPKRKVGCLIVSPSGTIKGAGFNNIPRFYGDVDALYHSPMKNDLVIHAELDAIMCSDDIEGCVAYVTSPPCAHCAKHLVAAGIAEVHHIGAHDPNSKWAEDWKKAEEIYTLASIPVCSYE